MSEMGFKLGNGRGKLSVRELDNGKLCIHWLMLDADGPINAGAEGQVKFRMWGMVAKGRIACNPTQNTVDSQERNGVHLMCLRSEDVQAATCPACLATSEAKAKFVELERIRKELETGIKEEVK